MLTTAEAKCVGHGTELMQKNKSSITISYDAMGGCRHSWKLVFITYKPQFVRQRLTRGGAEVGQAESDWSHEGATVNYQKDKATSW